MKVRIDLETCIRAGECYYNHPELLRMNANGDPELLITDLQTPEQIRHAREAAEVCPSAAIILEEDE